MRCDFGTGSVEEMVRDIYFLSSHSHGSLVHYDIPTFWNMLERVLCGCIGNDGKLAIVIGLFQGSLGP
jgi:hypothetical protein